MNIFEQLLADNTIPKFVKIRHHMCAEHVADIEQGVRHALKREGTLNKIRPGASVCITVGSRDVANITQVVQALCKQLQAVGAYPFIIPAMGSHAGCSAAGQRALIEGFGVTEEATGVPIRASMETVVIGHTKSGLEIHMDLAASEADFIIAIGRIKAHTDFRGRVESGICKMLVIGMGKQHGAYQCHKLGFKNMAANVLEFAEVIIKNKPNLFALGLIENAYHQTYQITAVPSHKILEEEPALLERSKEVMARLPFEQADILFVDETGKDISGAGMDPNVTGRSPVLGTARPYFQRIAVLDLTEKSHGNFGGLGSADVTTQRLYQKISFEQTYPNGITAAEPWAVRLPAVMPNDRTAMRMALRTATDCNWETGPRIVWLKNTLCLSEFYISEALLADARALEHVEILSEPMEVIFDADGNVCGWKEGVYGASAQG